jgi:hypothetical protein
MQTQIMCSCLAQSSQAHHTALCKAQQQTTTSSEWGTIVICGALLPYWLLALLSGALLSLLAVWCVKNAAPSYSVAQPDATAAALPPLKLPSTLRAAAPHSPAASIAASIWVRLLRPSVKPFPAATHDILVISVTHAIHMEHEAMTARPTSNCCY